MTGPFSPLGSLYWKPCTISPRQNGCPVRALVPPAKLNDCRLVVPPLAVSVTVAPATVRSPTTVAELPASFAVTTNFRRSGLYETGFFTTSCLPRMIWSAALVGRGATNARVSTRAMRIVRSYDMSGPLLSVRRSRGFGYLGNAADPRRGIRDVGGNTHVTRQGTSPPGPERRRLGERADDP